MTGPAEILRRLGEAGPSDRDLLARFAGQRDQAAFAELVRRHGPLVLGVCRRVTGHAEDAEDAFQAVFLVLARKAGQIAGPDLLGNWLHGVAARIASRARRSAVRRRAREVAVSPLPDPPAEPRATLAELGSILDEELAVLPEWYRGAILLCDLRGVSREEAARLLGVPVGTLSSRLANGRKKLAARLARRGVSLSVVGLEGMVGQAQAGVSVPNELFTKTCGLVADWAGGGPVPQSLIRLAEGGFAVRQTLLIGVLLIAVAAGAVVAAGSGDQNPLSERVRVDAVAKGEQSSQVKEKSEEAVFFTTQPRMQLARDLNLGNAGSIAWSPDGNIIAVQGTLKAMVQADVVNVTSTRFRENDGDTLGFSLTGSSGLIGFNPNGKELITDQREYNLVSGFHRLRFLETSFAPKKSFVNHLEPRTVDLDANDTHGYAFAPDGKTFRTIAFERDGSGSPRQIEVREVDAGSGKTLKSLMKIDYAQHVLSPNGKRLATFDLKGKLMVYDVDHANTLSTCVLPEPPALPPMSGTGFANFGGGFPSGFGQAAAQPDQPSLVFSVFSPDASRLVVSRAIGQTVVIDTKSGKPLPILESSEMMRTHPAPHAFSGDGRLIALTGQHYSIQKTTGRGGFQQKGGREQDALFPGRRFLTVWDTQTGKVLKSWDRDPLVAFNPARPVLAILEPNGENTTRLGLWDFSAEVEKK